MKSASVRFKLSFVVAILLFISFMGLSYYNFLNSKNSLKNKIMTQDLPILSNSISNNIKAELLPSITVASTISNNFFVKKWLKDGEKDIDSLKKYLELIKSNYNAFTISLVSTKTLNYYTEEGLFKTLEKNNPKDGWFFGFLNSKKENTLNVDSAEESGGQLTTFIDFIVRDLQNNIVGVAGIGLKVDSVIKILQANETKTRTVYLVDGNGYIRVHRNKKFIFDKSNSSAEAEKKNIKNISGIKAISASLMAKESGIYEYERDNEKIIISSAYLKEMGWYLFIEDKEDALLSEVSSLFFTNIIISLIVTLIAITLIILAINNIVIKQLDHLQKGLFSFFDFLNRKANNVSDIPVLHEDEFGKMAIAINKNTKSIKENLVQERQLIENTTEVVEKIKQGYLTDRISSNSSNKALNDLKDIINEMLDNLENNVGKDINIIVNTLENYMKNDFLKGIPSNSGKIELMINGLRESITKLLQNNKRIGLTLNENSKKLVNNVEHLNSNANSTAASIEETAAALEEITATVISNNESILQMSNYAEAVTVSVQEGEKLANKTNQSMDELNEQVTSINDSISLIDQIAFRTNILSLNAAVEAATAGEAGKGFAVVAQEVRNLASRSAEVAKEIKDLVQNATAKASEGKLIAANMLEGYSSLNENIQNTISIISDVSAASKEQKSGIEQINDAITQVDQQTQQIATIAGQTREIAERTNVIANDIVNDANEKEFEGKEQI